MFTTMAVEQQQAFRFIMWMSILAPVTFLQIDPRCLGKCVLEEMWTRTAVWVNIFFFFFFFNTETSQGRQRRQ